MGKLSFLSFLVCGANTCSFHEITGLFKYSGSIFTLGIEGQEGETFILLDIQDLTGERSY